MKKWTMLGLMGAFLLGGWNLQAQNAETKDGSIEGEQFKVEKFSRFIATDPVEDGDWRASMKNAMVMPSPLGSSEKDKIRAYKAELDKIREIRDREIAQGHSARKASGTAADQPTQGGNWFGNLPSGAPNDNDLAINAGGKIISVVNTSVYMYRASGGAPVVNKSLAAFVGLPGNAFVFDPRVVYDASIDRFVLIFLEGSDVGSSFIWVAFSETTDPFGAWNSYKITGTVNNKWTDYPQIAIGLEELYITGNMSPAGSNFVNSTTVWQVDKWDGFGGAASIDVKSYSLPQGETSWHPVGGGVNPYGPNAYFIRSAQSPFGTTKTFWIRELNNTIGNNGTLSNATAILADIGYSLPPNADQLGSTVNLNTNGAGVQSAYLENGKIEFALNSGVSGRPGLYYGTMTLSTAGLTFTAVNGHYVDIDSFHLGFPSIAYAGDDGNGNNKSILAFDYAGPDYYPGNATVYIDEQADYSAPLVLKAGFTSIETAIDQPNTARWGDYSGIGERSNNVGEAWFGGNIGRSGSNQNGTWISQIFAPGVSVVGVEEDIEESAASMTVYPNPAVEMVYIQFPVPQTKDYRVRILDVQGREVESFPWKKLQQGEGFFHFNAGPLESGVYFVTVEDEAGKVFSDKLVVNK